MFSILESFSSYKSIIRSDIGVKLVTDNIMSFETDVKSLVLDFTENIMHFLRLMH